MAKPHDRPLSRYVALITGSTSGIGEGIALCLASKGAHIILNGFGDENHIKNLTSSIKSENGVDVHFIGGDLTKESDVEALHSQAISLFPQGVDILVNNAGFQHVSPLESFSLDVWNKMMALMVTAPFHLSKLFIGKMKEKGWGRIINISSIHGHAASINKSGYVTAKHAILGLTKVIALEAAGTGVTCNAICPGYVETPLFIKQAEERATQQNISYEDARKQILSVHPSGESVKIEEVAESVAFLCSRLESQITGTSLMLDGGFMAR